MSDKPIEKLNDGLITAAIWRNYSDKGEHYSVSLSRAYKHGDDWKRTSSFSSRELLRVSVLAMRAYQRIGELRDAAKGGEA